MPVSLQTTKTQPEGVNLHEVRSSYNFIRSGGKQFSFNTSKRKPYNRAQALKLINGQFIMRKFSELSKDDGDGDDSSHIENSLVDDGQNVLLYEAEFDQLLDELVRRGSSVVIGVHRKMVDDFTDAGDPSDVKIGVKGCPLVTQSLARNLSHLTEERTMSHLPPIEDYGLLGEEEDSYDSDSEDDPEDY